MSLTCLPVCPLGWFQLQVLDTALLCTMSIDPIHMAGRHVLKVYDKDVCVSNKTWCTIVTAIVW